MMKTEDHQWLPQFKKCVPSCLSSTSSNEEVKTPSSSDKSNPSSASSASCVWTDTRWDFHSEEFVSTSVTLTDNGREARKGIYQAITEKW